MVCVSDEPRVLVGVEARQAKDGGWVDGGGGKKRVEEVSEYQTPPIQSQTPTNGFNFRHDKLAPDQDCQKSAKGGKIELIKSLLEF